MSLVCVIVLSKLFLLVSASSVDLKELREDILKFHTQWQVTVEDSFVSVYDAMAVTLLSSVPRLTEINESWLDVCEKFPYTSLNEVEERRLSNLCEDLGRFFRRIFQEIQANLDELHNGIVKDSLSDKVLENVFNVTLYELSQLMKDSKNETYTEELLKSFKSFIGQYAEEIISINVTFADSVSIKLRSVLRFFVKFTSDVETTVSKLLKCGFSEIDTIGCIQPLINYHCQKSIFDTSRSNCGTIYINIPQFNELNAKIKRALMSYQEKLLALNETKPESFRDFMQIC